jgi:hypothetical protein
MCNFCNQPRCSTGSYLALPSTPGDTMVNRVSDLCRNPTSRLGPKNRMVTLATKISMSAEPIYSYRQHQNIAVGFTSFQLSSILYCCYHKVKCLVQFHAFFLICYRYLKISIEKVISMSHFISLLLHSFTCKC